MPIAHIGPITSAGLRHDVDQLKDSIDSGKVIQSVFGISTGLGGTQDPIEVICPWSVDHAVADLAKERKIDAAEIYNYGVTDQENYISISYDVAKPNSFFIEYFTDETSSEPWILHAIWLARRKIL